MTKWNYSISKMNLEYREIAKLFNIRERALKLYYSELNPLYSQIFVGYSQIELDEELKYQLNEIEKDACLNLLAAIEAAFRVDYAIRIKEKDNNILSKKFRLLFNIYEYQMPLEDVLLEEWKKYISRKSNIISILKSAFQYRHWLAHGRYWILKKKNRKYDFYELYNLALQIEGLGLKKN